jgi:hypothetical protein
MACLADAVVVRNVALAEVIDAFAALPELGTQTMRETKGSR